MNARRFAFAASVALPLLVVAEAQAQRTKSSDSEPCCNITKIDVGSSVVTARHKTGKTFRFTVRDAALLRSLRVGQGVFADPMTARVSIKYGEPCCNIIADPAEPVNLPDVKPAEPCCGIMAVDSATGIVTARELATARAFRFEVKDRKLLLSLKTNQKIFADFGTSKVRIHGAEPCCNIIGHGVN